MFTNLEHHADLAKGSGVGFSLLAHLRQGYRFRQLALGSLDLFFGKFR